jgi:hypothetical protein
MCVVAGSAGDLRHLAGKLNVQADRLSRLLGPPGGGVACCAACGSWDVGAALDPVVPDHCRPLTWGSAGRAVTPHRVQPGKMFLRLKQGQRVLWDERLQRARIDWHTKVVPPDGDFDQYSDISDSDSDS